MATQMATQGSRDPLELMTPAQGKIIAGFEDLADITDGALALVLTWPPRARVCAPVWRRLAGLSAVRALAARSAPSNDLGLTLWGSAL